MTTQRKRVLYYDERPGCIAIYWGPSRNCLDGITTDPDCIYFVLGKNSRRGGWKVSWWQKRKAKKFYHKMLAKQ